MARCETLTLPLVAALVLAGCRDSYVAPLDPLYARAKATITQIRPRTIADLNQVMANDVTAVTSWWPIAGEASFNTIVNGVDLSVALKDCRTGYGYPVSVYETSNCSDIVLETKAWDGARGTLPNALCLGSPGARVTHTRLRDADKPWTLGGPGTSNLIGRTIAVRDPETNEPLACGTIEVADGGALADPPDLAKRPSTATILEVSGLCLFLTVATESCPDREQLADCAFQHCLGSCLDECREYIDCVDATSEPCSNTCLPSAACSQCANTIQCGLGFCQKQLSCTPPPTPGGPCTELRACCARQGPLASSCLEFAEIAERLSGDPSCLGTLHDWDFNTNFAYRSPCYPDGGVPEQ